MPPAKPYKLREDGGNYYRDPNAARSPKYPVEPAVRAILTENPEFYPQSIDIFACSSTMGNLLRFVRRIEKPFRFFVEVVGHTVFFIRHENSPTEFIPNVRGYGHTFPEAYTSWDSEVKGSTSNQRILKYVFDGLQCILRFECDGYLKSKVTENITMSTKHTSNTQKSDTGNMSLLLDNLNVTAHNRNTHQPLQVQTAGRRIPQAAVFDLKTRSARKITNVLEDELPRFWLAQIPNFILARHQSGLFLDVQVMDVSAKVKKWQQDSQNELRQLALLLRKIITAVKKRGDGKLEIRCKSLEALELREQDTGEHDVLSHELKTIWLEKIPPGGTDVVEKSVLESYSDGDTLKASHAGVINVKDSRLHGQDEESDEDYTGCSAKCGYCGHCSY